MSTITQQIQERIDDLEEMLTARTDGQGRPKPGYTTNVAMIKEEVRRLNVKLEEAHNDDAA